MAGPRPAKRRRLSPAKADDYLRGSFATEANITNKDEWSQEQDYEQRPRTLNKKGGDSNRLPIRTEEGWAEQAEASEEEDDELDGSVDPVDDGEDTHEFPDDEEPEDTPATSHRQQVLVAKEELAKLAAMINEDPEDRISSLRSMAQVAKSPNATVRKLALAAQVAVYKDIIPGYRIRPLGEEDTQAKLSKEVRKLRSFEQSLVKGYHEYINELAELSEGEGAGDSEDTAALASVALSCACNLLISVPHFNFRSEILKILVGKLSSRSVTEDFEKCRETIETLFRTDEDGYASMEAVAMLTKMIKARNYHVDESVLNTFLHLRLLSEFSLKGSSTSIDEPHGADGVENGQSGSKRMKRSKKEHRTKRQRKLLREQKVVEDEMKLADAAVSHEERDRMQAESLKLVFVTYFRILKSRTPRLMGAVLEGLARYAHLINQDFFGDILEVLKDLVGQALDDPSAATDPDGGDGDIDGAEPIAPPQRDATRRSLLCIVTAFVLLQGQDASKAAGALHLDLGFFVAHLYRLLPAASLDPDVELSARSLHLPDPTSPHDPHNRARTAPRHRVNVQTTAALLIRALTAALLPASGPTRAVPPVRVAAFARRLLGAALHVPERASLATLRLLQSAVRAHGRRGGLAGLWHTEERRGDGVWDPLCAEVERSNPFAGTAWEGEVLRRHYCPAVREAVLGVEKGVVDAR